MPHSRRSLTTAGGTPRRKKPSLAAVPTGSPNDMALQALASSTEGTRSLRKSLEALFALSIDASDAAKSGGGRTAGLGFAASRLQVQEKVSSEQLWGQLNVLYAPVLQSLERRVDSMCHKRSKGKPSDPATAVAPSALEADVGDALDTRADEDASEEEDLAPQSSEVPKSKANRNPEDAWRYAFGAEGVDEDEEEEAPADEEDAAEDQDHEQGEGSLGDEADPADDDAAAMAELYGEGQYAEEDYPFGGEDDDGEVGPEDEMVEEGEEGSGVHDHEQGSYPTRPNKGASRADFREQEDDDTTGLTSFELAERKRLRETSELEETRLYSKDWAMGGEVSAVARPRDALLDEKLEFEHAMRPVPVITAKATEKLEERIKRRIIDANFDDVQRRRLRTTAADLTTTKRDEGLEAQKSKLSLMDLYEKEYLEKQKKSDELHKGPGQGAAAAEQLTEIEKDELKAITMWKRLSQHLDALSNFYFTPLPVEQELEARVRAVEGHVPAVAMESVGVAGVVSTEAALAPQDLFRMSKSKFAGIDRSEMEPKEKRALRRQHKAASSDKKDLIQLVRSARARKEKTAAKPALAATR